MTKAEFLEGLRKALGNDLDRATVQENVSYYDGYISDEVRKGRTEEEVTAELGDPWVIAQTVIDAEETKRGISRDGGTTYTTSSTGYEDPVYGDGGDYTREDYTEQNQGYQTAHVHTFGFDTWWKKLLLVLGIIGVIVLVVAIVGGIVSLLAPIVIPILIVILLVRLIGGSGRR